jgi:hypothetical protein
VNELALIESQALRAEYAGRVEVLDKVKALSLLPDNIHATTELVARFFEVDTEAIKSVVRRHRVELEANGLRVLRGEELTEFERGNLTPSKRRSLSLFTRRTVLNVGQLLTESPVARTVRTYLLDVEDLATPDLRADAVERIERAALSRAQVLMLRAADGLLDHGWVVAKTKVVVARGLGEQPELDPADVPLYVPDFLKAKGLTKKQRLSVQSWFGRRAASLYEAEHGCKPGKRTEETPTGALRETFAWTRRDLSIFEEAWQRWYADDYPALPVQDDLLATCDIAAANT